MDDGNITGVSGDNVTVSETEFEHMGIFPEEQKYGMSIIAEVNSAQMYTNGDVTDQPTTHSYNLLPRPAMPRQQCN